MKTIDAINFLNLNNDFSLIELKSAYRKLASKNHPDHGGSIQKMQMINEAYALLMSSLSGDNPDKIYPHNMNQDSTDFDIFSNYFKFTSECIKFYFSMFK